MGIADLGNATSVHLTDAAATEQANVQCRLVHSLKLLFIGKRVDSINQGHRYRAGDRQSNCVNVALEQVLASTPAFWDADHQCRPKCGIESQ